MWRRNWSCGRGRRRGGSGHDGVSAAALALAATPRAMPQNSHAIMEHRVVVRDHAVRGFLGREGFASEQRRKAKRGRSADGSASRPPPKLPQTGKQTYRAPAPTRSARHRARTLASKCDLIKAIKPLLHRRFAGFPCDLHPVCGLLRRPWRAPRAPPRAPRRRSAPTLAHRDRRARPGSAGRDRAAAKRRDRARAGQRGQAPGDRASRRA